MLHVSIIYYVILLFLKNINLKNEPSEPNADFIVS